MAQSKRCFFRKGTDIQKRADIVVDLKRVDVKQINKWTLEQKIFALAFIKDCEAVFSAFTIEINKHLKVQ